MTTTVNTVSGKPFTVEDGINRLVLLPVDASVPLYLEDGTPVVDIVLMEDEDGQYLMITTEGEQP